MADRYIVNPSLSEDDVKKKMDSLYRANPNLPLDKHLTPYLRVLEMYQNAWSVEETSSDKTEYFNGPLSNTRASSHKLITYNFSGMPMQELISAGVFIKVLGQNPNVVATTTNKYQVTAKFNDQSFEACCKNASRHVPRDELAMYGAALKFNWIMIRHVDDLTFRTIEGNDPGVLDSNGVAKFCADDGSYYPTTSFLVYGSIFRQMLKEGLIAPYQGSASDGCVTPVRVGVRAQKVTPPPGLDNRKNTGSCPHCGTQTVVYASFSWNSRICPNCKA